MSEAILSAHKQSTVSLTTEMGSEGDTAAPHPKQTLFPGEQQEIGWIPAFPLLSPPFTWACEAGPSKPHGPISTIFSSKQRSQPSSFTILNFGRLQDRESERNVGNYNPKIQKHFFDWLCIYYFCRTVARAELKLFCSLSQMYFTGLASLSYSLLPPAPLCPAPPPSPHLRAPWPASLAGWPPPCDRLGRAPRGADSSRPAATRFVTLAELSP